MKKLAFLLFAAVTISAVSCKKDETISMRTRMITTGTWRLDVSSVISNINGETDITTNFLKDFTFRFGESDAFFRKGEVSGNTFETQSGTWNFKEADTRIVLTDTSLAGNYQIFRLDDTSMVILKPFTADGADSTARLFRTFKRAS